MADLLLFLFQLLLKRLNHFFHHCRILIRLRRFVDDCDIQISSDQFLGQGLEKFFRGSDMLSFPFDTVFYAGKMRMKFFEIGRDLDITNINESPSPYEDAAMMKEVLQKLEKN